MSAKTHEPATLQRVRVRIATLTALALAGVSAMLALPTGPAHAADSGNCNGTVSAAFRTHGGDKEKLFKNEPQSLVVDVSGSGDCTGTDPTITGVEGSGKAAVDGTCLNFNVTFSGRLNWTGPGGKAGWTSGHGSGTGTAIAGDIVVTINVAEADGGTKFSNGKGAGITIRFVGAGLECINGGSVTDGSGEGSGAGAA